MRFTLGKEISTLFNKAEDAIDEGNMPCFNMVADNIFTYIKSKKSDRYKAILNEKLDNLESNMIAAKDVEYFMDLVGVYR